MEHDESPIPTTDLLALADSALVPVARPLEFYMLPSRAPEHPIFLFEWSPRLALVDVAIVLCALVAIEILIGQSLSLFFDVPEPDTPAFDAFQRRLLLPVLIMRTAIVMALVIGMLVRRGQSLRSIGLGGQFTITNGIIHMVIGIACTGVAYALLISWLVASQYFWPGWIEEMGQNAQQLVNLIPAMHPLWFVPLMLMVGTYEEILFRGFVMTRLRRALGGWTPAVIVTTLLFTAAHVGDQKLAAMPIIAGLSIIFSIATIWRRSLFPAIIGHFLFNLSQMIGIYLSSPQWHSKVVPALWTGVLENR